MMPYNAYEINQARIQHMLEGDNRERLADIARSGNEKPNRMGKIMNVFHHILHRGTPDEQQASTVSEVIPSATNG